VLLIESRAVLRAPGPPFVAPRRSEVDQRHGNFSFTWELPALVLRHAIHITVRGAALALMGLSLAGAPPAAAHQGHCESPPKPDTTGSALRLRSIGAFRQPIYVTAARSDPDRLFVVEREGTVQVVVNGRRRPEPFLDISDRVRSDVNSEEGMQSIGRLYTFFSDRDGAIRVVEFRRAPGDPDHADPTSARDVLTVEHPGDTHHGGQLQFGPDGLLYVSIGDAGGTEYSQDLRIFLGKILRIDPRPSLGASYASARNYVRFTPFNGAEAVRPEIWAYGLRNPFRFSFDRLTGALALADVGQDKVEEVDFLPGRRDGTGPRSGANFGWAFFEGSLRERVGRYRPQDDALDHVPPVIERRHPRAHSVTGGYVIRDPNLGGYQGRYVYGDFCDGSVRTAVLRRPKAAGDRSEGLTVPYLSSFGESAPGHLYATSLLGRVYRVERRR